MQDNQLAITTTITPPELLIIGTPEGDCAFYVNGESIITAEAGTDDVVDDVTNVATNMSDALGLPIRKVDFQFGEGNNKTWSEMYDALKENKVHVIFDVLVDNAAG